MSELHMYHFYFFYFAPARVARAVFFFFASAAVVHGIIVLLKKLLSYFMNFMYKHIFLNFGVISFINKEMISLFQLHTYKFGLVYLTLLNYFWSLTVLMGDQAIVKNSEIHVFSHRGSYRYHLHDLFLYAYGLRETCLLYLDLKTELY